MTELTAIFIKSEQDFQSIKTQIVEEFLTCWKDLRTPVEREDYLEFKKEADDAFELFKNAHTRFALFHCVTSSFEEQEDYLRIANDYISQYMSDRFNSPKDS